MGTRIIGVDFESTFSSEHTLTKMSIEEYVRHPKFEVIGCGIRDFQTGESCFATGGEVRRALASIRDDAWVAHHSQFDGFIAHTVYDAHPSFWFDTLSMSRALHQHLPSHSLDKLVAHFHLGAPKIVPYNKFRGKALAELDSALLHEIGVGCEHDLFLTYQLYELLVHQMPADELELIDETIRLYTEPVLEGDVPLLREALQEAIVARESKMHELGLTDDVLKSDRKFATLLRGAGVEPPTKISATTGREAFAFAKSDLEFQALLEHEDGRVRDLVEARFAAKTSIHETRAGRLLGMAERGSMPVYLKHYGCHTGRPAGGDRANFLNLTRGSKLRQGLVAPEGHVLVWGDLSQIECRLTAWLAGCETLLNAFRDGRDVYSEFGTKAFKCEVSKTTNHERRRPSKETVLGCGYGLGKEMFSHYMKVKGLGLDRNTTDFLVDSYRREYREIPDLWRTLDGKLKFMERLDGYTDCLGPLTFDGRKIYFPDDLFLDYTDQDFSKIWGGKTLENIIQKLAWIVLKDAWLKVRRAFDARGRGRVVLPVYDELVCCVPLTDRQWCLDMLGTALVTVPEWAPNLPLAAELFSGDRYDKSSSEAISRTSEEN